MTLRCRRASLHIGRLGMKTWQLAYRRDFIARHWWVDLGWYRLVAILKMAEPVPATTGEAPTVAVQS